MSESLRDVGPEIAYNGRQLRLAAAARLGVSDHDALEAVAALDELERRILPESARLDNARPCDIEELREVWRARSVLVGRNVEFSDLWDSSAAVIERYHVWLAAHDGIDDGLRAAGPAELAKLREAWTAFGTIIGHSGKELEETVDRALTPSRLQTVLTGIAAELARSVLAGMPDTLIRLHITSADKWGDVHLAAVADAVRRDGMTDSDEDRARFALRMHAGEQFEAEIRWRIEALRRCLTPEEGLSLHKDVLKQVMAQEGAMPSGIRRRSRIDRFGADVDPLENALAEGDERIGQWASAPSALDIRSARLAITRRLDSLDFPEMTGVLDLVSRRRLKRQEATGSPLPLLCADAARLVLWHADQLRPNSQRPSASAVFSDVFREAMRVVDPDRYDSGTDKNDKRHKNVESDVPVACHILLSAARATRTEVEPEALRVVRIVEFRSQIAYLETARTHMNRLVGSSSDPSLVLAYVGSTCEEFDDLLGGLYPGALEQTGDLGRIFKLCAPYCTRLLPALQTWQKLDPRLTYVPLRERLSKFASALIEGWAPLAIECLRGVNELWTVAVNDIDEARRARFAEDIRRALILGAVLLQGESQVSSVLDPGIKTTKELRLAAENLFESSALEVRQIRPVWRERTWNRVASALENLRAALAGLELFETLPEGEAQ